MRKIFDGVTVTDIVSVQTIRSQRGRHSYIKDRPSYGISFCTEGQITYYMDGVQTVSTPERAVILPMGKAMSSSAIARAPSLL